MHTFKRGRMPETIKYGTSYLECADDVVAGF